MVDLLVSFLGRAALALICPLFYPCHFISVSTLSLINEVDLQQPQTCSCQSDSALFSSGVLHCSGRSSCLYEGL